MPDVDDEATLLAARAVAIGFYLDSSEAVVAAEVEPVLTAADVRELREAVEVQYAGLHEYADAILRWVRQHSLSSFVERCPDSTKVIENQVAQKLADASDALGMTQLPNAPDDAERVLRFYAYLCREEARLRDEEKGGTPAESAGP
jgi:hypothetical protein